MADVPRDRLMAAPMIMRSVADEPVYTTIHECHVSHECHQESKALPPDASNPQVGIMSFR